MTEAPAFDWREYRKPIAMLVTALFVFTMESTGVTVQSLSRYGITTGPLVAAVVDFILTYGPPAVALIAQPNKLGDRLVDNWRWVAGGAVVLGLALVLTVALL